MYSETPSKRPMKRPNEESSAERPRKNPWAIVVVDDNSDAAKLYKFRILMPNGRTLELKMPEKRREVPIDDFMLIVGREYIATKKEGGYPEKRRRIKWDYDDLHFTDARGKKIRFTLNLNDFMPIEQWHILKLHDGSAEPEVYDDMWDLTPDTDLLKELPEDYTFETALADLIDNSLQAVWSNHPEERRLISVELLENKISIFDSGPGMDGSDGNIVKWGKMGASLHRSSRGKAAGGKPPYLTPCFGMFGYGGPVATMHLGRCAIVSSKTKNCNKVYTLHLEKDALVNSSHLEKRWRTKGGVRDPTKAEKENSPHGSFTRVDIFGLKMRSLDAKLLQCKLKDIYFPYIQCDDLSGKTHTPIEFQVNGDDLSEIVGGEQVTTNLHSSPGSEFILQLRFHLIPDNSLIEAQRTNTAHKANARLKCVYFPVIEGEENINRIIDELEKGGLGLRESFECFSRVSIRRLGRLLPDARWPWLPFMEPKLRKGDKAEILKRCCYRVKCFIDTDSGFNPTPSKTDLAHHHPFTSALKIFGSMTLEDKKEVEIEIYRDGKKLNLSQVEKQYHEWIFKMHDCFDEEIGTGLLECTVVFLSKEDKRLARFSDVSRVLKEIKRKGSLWKAGQKIKILKGACAGCHKNNTFATLEHILLDGLQGDTCGEAVMICRPLGIPEEKGCYVSSDNKINLQSSILIPLNVIDDEKCIAVGDVEWESRLAMHEQRLPSSIEILSHAYCQQLEIEGGLLNVEAKAGDVLPQNIVCVFRPKSFKLSRNSNKLEQKFIYRNNALEMTLSITFKAGGKNGETQHIYSGRIKPVSCKGYHGLYIFQAREKFPKFHKAGHYTFSFTLAESDVHFEQVVQVNATVDHCSWRLINDKNEIHELRVGSPFPQLSVACYDQYDNKVSFETVPILKIILISKHGILGQASDIEVDLASDNLTMIIKDIVVISRELDKIRPDYKASLFISTPDENDFVNCQCRVVPGIPSKIKMHQQVQNSELVPGQILNNLSLEVFDNYGNRVKEDELIHFCVDGFSILEGTTVIYKSGTDYMMKADANGCVNLSNLLKVSKGYDKDVILSVISERETLFKLEFKTEKRELRTATKVFKQCEAGSQLENIGFEITNPEGSVDETINDDEKSDQLHTLKISSDSFDIDDSVRYSFRRGRCTIRAIPLPKKDGTFSFKVAHSRYPELCLELEVHVERVWREGHEVYENLDSTQATYGNLTILPQSTPVVDRECYTPKSYKRNTTSHNNSPFAETPDTLGDWSSCSRLSGNVPFSEMFSIEKLKNDLAECGMIFLGHQRKIEMLEHKRSRIQNMISVLQASLGSYYVPPAFANDSISKQIENRRESAAAVICKSLKELPFEERRNIFGVVALLGSVQCIELSRMLAKYLGEEQMLAIVCENYEAAETLDSIALTKLANEFGISVTGGYQALCLEDIRPKISWESRRYPVDPTLPDGNRPQGFLGYAVNLINIEASLSNWRTKSGHGLRETLFYRLFGELQVYQDRHCMKMARSCIEDGAISLDGGIMKGNGLVSLGHWEPEICFPVTTNKTHSPSSLRIVKQIEAKELELVQLDSELEKENEVFQIESEDFELARQRYKAFENETLSQASLV